VTMTATVEETWSSGEVVRMTAATYRQLDYWCSMGLVPGMAACIGQGYRRRFAYEQVRHVRGLLALSRAGVTGDQLREAVERLADPALDWYRPLTLVWAPHVTLSVDLAALA
jgi:DNA-binding transcriptional MerR regulator